MPRMDSDWLSVLLTGENVMGRFFTSADRQEITDGQASKGYHYMLRTAPPESIEQAHTEAFAQLTPSQRRQVFEELAKTVPQQERPFLNEDPRSLAKAATRAELRTPGLLERLFGSAR